MASGRRAGRAAAGSRRRGRCGAFRSARAGAATVPPDRLRHRDHALRCPSTGRASRSVASRTSATRPGKPTRCPITGRRCSRCRTSCSCRARAMASCSARGAAGKPVHVVPHIRRHAWNTRDAGRKARVAPKARHTRRSFRLLHDRRLGSAQGARRSGCAVRAPVQRPRQGHAADQDIGRAELVCRRHGAGRADRGAGARRGRRGVRGDRRVRGADRADRRR